MRRGLRQHEKIMRMQEMKKFAAEFVKSRRWKCSACGYLLSQEEIEEKYCPSCGNDEFEEAG